MALTSTKNQMTLAASSDLGLGDQLKSQVEDELAQRRKKLLKPGLGQLTGTGPATQSLFGNAGGLGNV